MAIKRAYLTFLARNKHLMVPVKFVVPSGDDLWPKAAWVYASTRSGAEAVERRRAENQPGTAEGAGGDVVRLGKEPATWDHLVFPALRRFYELNGHTDVPQDFRIPTGDPKWPEQLWGQKLGRKAANIRFRGDFAEQVKEDAKALERIKFCHDSSLSDRDWREKLIPALKVFRQEFGHCNVGQDFTVPSSSPWPKAAWKMRLGNAVNAIRKRQLGAGQDLRELDELGFVWNHFEAEWTERILPALKAFREIEGHCRIPIGFVVPADPSWSKQLWRLKLGRVVCSIRNVGRYSAQVSQDRSQLETLGIVWDPVEADWSERILPALEVYRQLCGDCRVPTGFIVPSDDKWPEKSWGLRLGQVVRSIRCRKAYSAQVSRDEPHLKDLGFVLNFYEAEWNGRILPALKTYFEENGHSRVPQTFVVLSDAAWPIEAHGLKLGFNVSSIRCYGAYFDYTSRSVDTLQEIGFELKIPDARWKGRVEPLLTTFKQLHGHRNVPLDFVVPSEVPWSEKDWGIQLGKLERKMPSQEA